MRWCILLPLLALLPLMVLAQAPKAVKWGILPLAHPDSKLLLGIDWRKVLESPLGPTLQKQVALGGHPLFGFLDSIENLDRLLVSSPGGGGPNGKGPLLVVGEGRFALNKIRQMAKADGAVSRRYNDIEILVPPNATTEDLHFVLIDSHTILFGDGISVKAAVDRWQSPNEDYLRSAIFQRAIALSGSQEIWAVANDPSDALTGLGINANTLSEQVDSIEMGINVAQTFNATLLVKANTEEAASMLATGLPALLQIAALTYNNQPSLAQVSKRLKVMNEKGYLKMAVALDAKLLDLSLNDLRASMQGREAQVTVSTRMATPTTAVAASAPAALPQAPTRRVIRIIGEDGVREIPYNTPPND